MARSDTRPVDLAVDAYLRAKASSAQLDDARALMALCERVTGEPAAMSGPSIVAHGTYHYRYESGRTGSAPLVGFAVRGREFAIYLAPDMPSLTELAGSLGPHRMGKGCLYVRRLADVDVGVLQAMVEASVAELRRRYPARPA